MLKKLLVLSTIIYINVKISIQDNVITYNEMPPLYKFDDYDECVREATLSSLTSSSSSSSSLSSALYCMVFSKIRTDNTSPLWLYIQEYSNDTKNHYRHDHLYFGVCIKRCERVLWQNTLNNNSNKTNSNNNSSITWNNHDKLQQNDIDDEIISYFDEAYESETLYRLNYQQLINNCVNYEFQLQYKLQLQTYIEYCIEAKNSNSPWFKDNIDRIVCLIFISIIICNFLSTIYDYYLKQHWEQNHKQNHMDFFKVDLNNSRERFLSSFSICRNYYSLLRPLRLEQFEFFNGIRVLCVFLVIMAHVLMLFVVSPLKNPQYFENLVEQSFTMIFKNGTVILQVFFFLSAFFLKYNFEQLNAITPRTNFTNCVKTFLRIFIGRYLRFAIPVLILIIFNVTFANKLREGLFWQHVSLGEITMCRKYWWKNVFMINNFSFKESCSQHTWYLAADLQLYTFFSIVLILMARFPKIKYPLYGVLGILSVIVPFIVTWFFQLDGVYHFTPESYRYLFFKDAVTFYISYIPSYTNLGSYLCGVIFADFYLNRILQQQQHDEKQEHKEDEQSVKKAKLESQNLENSIHFKFLSYLIYPAWFLLLCSGLLLNENFLKKPFGTALYDALYRNLWSLVTFYALYGLFSKYNYKLYNALNLRIWRPLARLSYQAYIWHLVVLRYLFGSIKEPFDTSILYMIYIIFHSFFIIMIVAFFVVIFFESPCQSVIRLMFHRGKQQQQSCPQKQLPHND